MHVVTFVTDKRQDHFKNVFFSSCKHNHLNLTVLTPPLFIMLVENFYKDIRSRLGLKTKFFFLRKNQAIQKFLRRQHADDIVLFTDSYDAILLAAKREILNKYEKFPRPLVFSAEKPCHPPGNSHKFPTSETSLRFLNSGGYIGPAGVMLKALDEIQAKGFQLGSCDQLAWQKLFWARPDVIALDYRAEIFLCMAEGPNKIDAKLDNSSLQKTINGLEQLVSVDGRRIKFLETGENPCQVHFNGPSKKFLKDPLLKPILEWDHEP